MSQRASGLRATAFDRGANRLPHRDTLVNVSEQVRAERSAVTAPVVGEKLALEPGDVHADGTLGLAGPAFETQIEHLPHALVTEPRFADPPRHGQAQNVRASSRRVRLFPRRHVGRAHRPVQRLAARTEAAAHLDRARQAAMLGIVEERRRLHGAIRRPVAQAGGERRRIDDLAGVEDAVRIEGLLDVAERLVEGGAEHPFHEAAADETVAVFPRQRPAVGEHQVGAGGGDRLELADSRFRLQVDDRPHVQAAHGRVRIDAGRRAVAADHLQELVDVVAESFGRDRGVFDERQRLAIALHRHRKAQGSLAKGPDRALRRRLERAMITVAEPARDEIPLERVETRRQVSSTSS